MKFAYNDAEYDLVSPDTWTTLEALKLEKHTGKRTVELMTELADATPLGVHCGAWISLHRAGVDVAWDELELPWLATIESFRGEPVQAAPDPSTASTGAPTTGKRTQSASARQRKK